MEKVLISQLELGKKNKISGYIENLRNKKSMAFLVVRDESGSLQVTLEKEKYPSVAAIVDTLTINSFIVCTGDVVENSYVKLNGREMLIEDIEVDSIAEALPIQDDSAPDLRMDYRWIDLRSEKNLLIFKAQTLFVKSMRDFLLDKDFIEIHSPKLIGAASESGADVFELKYFDRKAYLCQSPQFYKQMAMASGFDRIFEVGPVFRAEKSHTNKHATEFTGFDLEFSHIDSVNDVMKMEEDLLTYALEKVNEKYGEDIKRLYGLEVIVPKKPFPVIKLADLYDELEKRYGFTVPESEKGDLTTEAERLCKKFSMEVYGHEFLFVTDYGAEKRAFYHMRKDGIPQGYDLIWRGCEITTGAQREHRYEILKAQAKEKGLDEDVKFYLEFFRYGCPAHGGFGLGVDRLTMLLLGLTIKDCMFIFRGPDRLNP